MEELDPLRPKLKICMLLCCASFRVRVRVRSTRKAQKAQQHVQRKNLRLRDEVICFKSAAEFDAALS